MKGKKYLAKLIIKIRYKFLGFDKMRVTKQLNFASDSSFHIVKTKCPSQNSHTKINSSYNRNHSIPESKKVPQIKISQDNIVYTKKRQIGPKLKTNLTKKLQKKFIKEWDLDSTNFKKPIEKPKIFDQKIHEFEKTRLKKEGMYRKPSKSLNPEQEGTYKSQKFSILRTRTNKSDSKCLNDKKNFQKKVSFRGTKTIFRFNPEKRIAPIRNRKYQNAGNSLSNSKK